MINTITRELNKILAKITRGSTYNGGLEVAREIARRCQLPNRGSVYVCLAKLEKIVHHVVFVAIMLASP